MRDGRVNPGWYVGKDVGGPNDLATCAFHPRQTGSGAAFKFKAILRRRFRGMPASLPLTSQPPSPTNPTPPHRPTPPHPARVREAKYVPRAVARHVLSHAVRDTRWLVFKASSNSRMRHCRIAQQLWQHRCAIYPRGARDCLDPLSCK